MSRRRRPSRALLGCVTVALACALAAGPARAGQDVPASAITPLRLVPTGAEPLRVRGLHDYLGEIELKSAADGLVVVNSLPLERYLLGLNEVPTDWPMAALRAQSVAARTYALWTLQRPRGGVAATYGFDICASELCQVFAGADVIGSSGGERWEDAVQSTAGEVLLYGGRPILARYHSTSGGRTLDNTDAFPDEAPQPYLRSVASPTEGASPLYRWKVVFGLEDLQRMLEAAGWWGDANGRLLGASTIASAEGLHYPDVVFDGRRDVQRSAEELRAALRTLAPRMFPARYPSDAPVGGGRLPETLPSNRFTVDTIDGSVAILGRGWGHGVGMSQWGARGLAAQGMGYRDILRHYYPGTRVGRAAHKQRVGVGIDWGRRVVGVFGSFRLVDATRTTLLDRALGTWRFSLGATGAVDIAAPPRWGRPLQVRVVRAPERVAAGARVRVVIELSTPASVTITATSRRSRGRGATLDAGSGLVSWRAPRKGGRYDVRVRARTAGQARATAPFEIQVVPRRASGGNDRAVAGEGAGVVVWLAAIVLLGLTAVGAASFAGTIRR